MKESFPSTAAEGGKTPALRGTSSPSIGFRRVTSITPPAGNTTAGFTRCSATVLRSDTGDRGYPSSLSSNHPELAATTARRYHNHRRSRGRSTLAPVSACSGFQDNGSETANALPLTSWRRSRQSACRGWVMRSFSCHIAILQEEELPPFVLQQSA